MIRRLFADEADKVNEWVYRDLGARADFTEFLSHTNNVCLVEGEGGAIFGFRGPGIYEVHVFFEQRGRDVIELSHRILDWMRENEGAWLFWAAVPYGTDKQSRKVRAFTRLMGWKSKGVRNLSAFVTGPHELFIGE